MSETATKENLTIMVDEKLLKQTIEETVRESYNPRSVYRVQFNKNFSFKDAVALLPYLKDLGVDALYSSPIFQSTPGSLHGYNVTDPNQINPEIGSDEDFFHLCDMLKESGMGLILDVVPNHMGISGNNNGLWTDVLENGPSSTYAHFFDIDWNPSKMQLKNKILVPVMGGPYGKILDNQEIKLSYQYGHFTIVYHEHSFPVAPDTYVQILENQLQDLDKTLPKEDEEYQSFLSIITAFRNLPPRTETDPSKKLERNREKEISKKRLNDLVCQSQTIENFVKSRVMIFNGQEGKSETFNLLDQLLNDQSYRMAFWQVASEEINYRRFFDINELAAIRMENRDVFRHHHQLVFDLIRKGRVQGLRIDHPDGLFNPNEYFMRLQCRYIENKLPPRTDNAQSVDMENPLVAMELEQHSPSSNVPLYVVVEKILDRDESLPDDWRVSGTVGYKYLNVLNGLFVFKEGEDIFNRTYAKFVGKATDFEHLVYEKKKFFALVHMSSEFNTLGHRLDQISESSKYFRDFTKNNLTLAIREVASCFPVYRTYIRPDDKEVSGRDKRYILEAVEKAKKMTPALNPVLYDFLRDILLLQTKHQQNQTEQILFMEFVMKFQQLTAPLMAKGLEDTAFYIHNRLLSLNEVGGDPTHFGYTKEAFHKINIVHKKRWPGSLITSLTHDTKRSEDARMRLNALTEISEVWQNHVLLWSRMNRKHRSFAKNLEYFIYQTLIAVWPIEAMSDSEYPAFVDRIWTCIRKSLREAKTDSNWINPNLHFEESVLNFLKKILNTNKGNRFLESFVNFQKKVAHLGMMNSLSAQTLRIGSVGVPDVYQGNESWNLTMVDPDNRRPVDFESLIRNQAEVRNPTSSGLSQAEFASHLLTSREDGRIKQFTLQKALHLRKDCGTLFLKGDYLPLDIKGRRSNNVVAFLRQEGDRKVVVAAVRYFNGLGSTMDSPIPKSSLWEDTSIIIPPLKTKSSWTDWFTLKKFDGHGQECRLLASELFSTLGVVMLINDSIESSIKGSENL